MILSLEKKSLPGVDAAHDPPADETEEPGQDPAFEDAPAETEVDSEEPTDTIPEIPPDPVDDCGEAGSCFDDNPCTSDTCGAGGCEFPPLPNGTPCSGGLCCGGICRIGGNCCDDSDCEGQCQGEVQECGMFPTRDACESQLGCRYGDGACFGTPYNCMTVTDSVLCTTCGCSWHEGTSQCSGAAWGCGNMLDETTCTTCRCTWSLCDGTHAECATYLDAPTCSTQEDCYWYATSSCSDYTCR